MTAPDEPRTTAWSRRNVLRSLALPAIPALSLPLLALDGCSDDASAPSTSAAGAQAGGQAGGQAGAQAGGQAGTRNGSSATIRPSSPAPSGSATAPAPAGSGTASGARPTSTPPSPDVEVSQAPGVTDAVALTFHGDGPPAMAEALLTEAERGGARLTVLAVGRWLGKYPQMAERVLHGGHELGNHTEHHLNIDRMSESLAYNEIEQCAVRLEQLTGSRGRWFRQSQGQHATPEVYAAATRAGYSILLSYDLDSLDFRDPGSSAVVRNVLSRIRGGDVVSMHLGHPGTVTALPLILAGLQQRGLRAVTASELFPLSPSAGGGPPHT